MKLLHKIVLLSCSFILLAACQNAENGKEDNEGEGKQEVSIEREAFGEVFLEGNYERVYDQMSKSFQKEVSLEELQQLGEDFNEDVSSYVLHSSRPYGEKMTQYIWTDESESKGMIVVFDEEDIIQGLQIMPLPTYPETDEIFTKTTFDVPFEEKWFVFWGGTNPLINYHYEHESQRYAYDFVVMEENTTFEGDADKNESYFAFGKNYLAPADGKVVKIENEIKDNEPVGKMNEDDPLGNHVIIDHGNGEYSYLAHFKYNSIEVKEGDDVKRGDLLGLVGNSGNSSEPHIHFHVADSPDWEKSKSIRVMFDREDMFIQGDYVE